MRIVLRKLTDERHLLEVVRDCGIRESVACESRSFLLHDLLHYATESAAGVANGFWGRLAAGATLSELNDKERQGSLYDQPDMLVVEQVVGAMTGVVRGRSGEEIVAGMRQLGEAQGVAMPAWLTPAFVEQVQARMRALLGRWNATPYGGELTLDWP